VILFEEVNCKFRHTALTNNNGDTGFSELLDKTFKLVFLSFGVTKKFSSVVQKYCSFGLTLLHFNVSVEHGYLGVCYVTDRSFRAF